MILKDKPAIEIPAGLLDAIESFPLERVVEHCGMTLTVPPFDFYADCPKCKSRIKVRSFSAMDEIEDIFDAVFEWMIEPNAREVAKQRIQVLTDERDEL
jgi:hypothetical protein